MAIEALPVALESCCGTSERAGGGFGFFALFCVEVQDEARAGAVLTGSACAVVVVGVGAGRSIVASSGFLESETRHFWLG